MFGLERTLGSRLVTYADDLVILCRRGKTEAALQRLREITGKLKLTVSEEKTRICKVPEGEFDFLGYTFRQMYSARTGQARIGYRPSKKSIQRAVEKVHPCGLYADPRRRRAASLQTARACRANLRAAHSAWDVLRTMTPSDYSEFRDRLGQSSGFQSWQYRAIEFLAGNRNLAMLRPHDHRPEIVADLTAILAEPSLYQEAILLLSRRGLDVGEAAQRAVAAEPHVECEALIGAWAEVYRDPAHYWDLYELAEKLIDFEDYLRRWRFNHVTTVERIIGLKRGTGGTSGVGYLKRMLEIELFPELWRRTRMRAQSPRPSPSL